VPTSATANPLRTLDEVEAEHIQRVLNHTGGHKGNSCEVLGISRPALDRKIKKYALTLP
jgi:two-component system response regulator AtoC